MRIWQLRPYKPTEGPWVPWYDKCFGFVVLAESAKEAREMASAEAGDEGADAWQSGSLSSCVEIDTLELCAGILMRDFHSA